jgi:hypothetical protein
METRSSVPCSQKPTIVYYPELVVYGPSFQIIQFNTHFNIILLTAFTTANRVSN